MSKTLEFICEILIWGFIIAVVCLMLSSCTRKTPVEHAFDGVQQAIVQAKDTLPAECKTEQVLARFDELESKRIVAENVCEAKIKDVQIKYERTLWLIFLIILAFFAKNFIKK